jgi:hypothetical protein
LSYPNGQRLALDYRVSSDGSIRESSIAGGIDYYALPAGTWAFLPVCRPQFCGGKDRRGRRKRTG